MKNHEKPTWNIIIIIITNRETDLLRNHHQCWFGLDLMESYIYSSFCKLYQMSYKSPFPIHQYGILFFFCFLVFLCPTATWWTEPMWAMQSWSLTWRATILERSAFPSFLAAKSWRAKKFITVFFLQILNLTLHSIPDGSTSLWTSWWGVQGRIR